MFIDCPLLPGIDLVYRQSIHSTLKAGPSLEILVLGKFIEERPALLGNSVAIKFFLLRMVDVTERSAECAIANPCRRLILSMKCAIQVRGSRFGFSLC